MITFRDPPSGLKVFVAIHSTVLGPALGGTRFWEYPDSNEALGDALRLSRAMSYKCALAGLPSGGGKAVILKGPGVEKTPELLAAYGEFLNTIGDQFATGADVGFSLEDCETLRAISPYVAGTESFGIGDPSPYTAQGALIALQAVVRRVWRSETLTGLEVAIQGLGSVGMDLCRRLSEHGVRLKVADPISARARAARDAFAAVIVSPEEIITTEADLLAPSGLGAAIGRDNVDRIQVRAVVGPANNQLTDKETGRRLRDRGVLWAPDYVVSAGGIIAAADEVSQIPGRGDLELAPLTDRLAAIGTRLNQVFDEADSLGVTTGEAALSWARRLLSA